MEYIRPATLKQAVSLLRENGLALAGGTVLVPAIKHAFENRQMLVDLGHLDELRHIKMDGQVLRIGAAVPVAQLANEPTITAQLPALAQAALAIGNPQVRRVGTIGGNVAIGIAGADLPPALLALDAHICLTNSDVEKLVPLQKVLADGVPAGHLITAISIEIVPSRLSGFRKFAWRKASGKTIVNTAAAVHLRNKTIDTARLVAGGLSRAHRLPQAEGMLAGKALEASLIDTVAQTAAAEATCTETALPAEKYRRKLVQTGIHQILTEMAT